MKDITSPTYGAYIKCTSYCDFGESIQVESNHLTAGLRIQATDSAVLPVGLQLSTSTGTITKEIEFVGGQGIVSGAYASNAEVYAGVSAALPVGSMCIATGKVYIKLTNNGAEADWQVIDTTDD